MYSANTVISNSFTKNLRRYSKSHHFWNEKENVLQFLAEIKKKQNLQTFDDWNSITQKHIISHGGSSLLHQYSMYDLKCLGYPEGKLKFEKPKQTKPLGYWQEIENVKEFLNKLKEKYNFKTSEDWNSINRKLIISNGGNSILNHYSLFHLKCLGYPDGKDKYDKPNQIKGYWNDKNNVKTFLDKLTEKYNLKSPKDWISITQKEIISNGGSRLLSIYSMNDLKGLACPKNKFLFYKSSSDELPSEYWNDKDNVNEFLIELKEKYNLKTMNDWNLITKNQIILNGGKSLLDCYSLYDLKCLGFPDGKFKKSNQKKGFWDKEENILQFLNEFKEKLNLNSPEDWNLVTQKQIQLHGGSRLFSKYSLYEIKCLACPDGKLLFNESNPYKSSGYWTDQENVKKFLNELKISLRLFSPNDWNEITQNDVSSHGGSVLLHHYSMYELKCLGCPEGIHFFTQPSHSNGFWDEKENVLQFINHLKSSLHLETEEDWNLITSKQIQSLGGSSLLNKYSMYEIKCMGFPEGKTIFNKRKSQKSSKYWNNEENRNQFIEKLKLKFNLKTPQDWKRLSIHQIKSNGGLWLFKNDMEFMKKISISFNDDENNNIISFPLIDLLADSNGLSKRSSQRWLFLQIQKLFPHDEIVEDYFHSDLSRESGFNIQFDVFLTNKNIAFEYHGQQHYEDIPGGFASLEMHKNRDLEKEQLCKKFGIHLIVIPYWWDNKLDSLKKTLNNLAILQYN